MEPDYVALISSKQQTISTLQAEAAAIAAMPARSRGEVIEAINASIDAWHEELQTDLSAQIQAAANGQPFAPFAVTENSSLGPLLVHLLGKDAARQSLHAGLKSVPRGMPSPERVTRTAAINAQISQLEADIVQLRALRIAQLDRIAASAEAEKQSLQS
jgi:hypothetical protein